MGWENVHSQNLGIHGLDLLRSPASGSHRAREAIPHQTVLRRLRPQASLAPPRVSPPKVRLRCVFPSPSTVRCIFVLQTAGRGEETCSFFLGNGPSDYSVQIKRKAPWAGKPSHQAAATPAAATPAAAAERSQAVWRRIGSAKAFWTGPFRITHNAQVARPVRNVKRNARTVRRQEPQFVQLVWCSFPRPFGP